MSTTSRTHATLRILAGVAALVPTGCAVLSLTNQVRSGFDMIGAIMCAATATLAFLCWSVAVRGQLEPMRSRLMFAAIGGLALGGIGFAAGFFGPIVLAPDANQGPLLGIFITGPLGFAVGAAIGWF